MGCNCNKTTHLSMGCCQPVLAPVENYYTKYQIDQMLSGDTSGCCITPEEVDERIASAKTEIEAEIPTIPTVVSAFDNDVPYLTEHQSLSGYATEQWVEDKGYITGVDLSNYATLEDLPDLTDYALKSEIPTSNSGLTNDAQYITSGDTVFNNYMLKNNIWCGDYAAWSLISGSTQNDVLYLIHQ